MAVSSEIANTFAASSNVVKYLDISKWLEEKF